MSKSKHETAKQNQKFPFHFFFRFAAEGWGEEAREKCKEIFWSLHTRVRERVRGALVRFTTQLERTIQFQATTRSARAISRNQGSIQNTFELRSIHTATVEFALSPSPQATDEAEDPVSSVAPQHGGGQTSIQHRFNITTLLVHLHNATKRTSFMTRRSNR